MYGDWVGNDDLTKYARVGRVSFLTVLQGGYGRLSNVNIFRYRRGCIQKGSKRNRQNSCFTVKNRNFRDGDLVETVCLYDNALVDIRRSYVVGIL